MKQKNFLLLFSRFTRLFIVSLFILIGCVVLVHSLVFQNQYTKTSYYSLLIVLVGVTVLFCFVFWSGRVAEQLERKVFLSKVVNTKVFLRGIFAFLLLLCFCVRMVWVVRFPIEPSGDYGTFYGTAVELGRSFDISGWSERALRYVALFPHIFGYASFLGLLFVIFGASPMVAAVTNVVLSTISMALIYYICIKLSGRSLAIVASLVWIFYPSQIIYNMFVLSEPYYTMLLLASIALIIFLQGRLRPSPYWKVVLIGAALGAILALVNSVRPVSIIVIIALVVVLFIIQPAVKNSGLRKKSVILVCLCVTYFAGGVLNNWIFTQRIGEEPASVPGFNIYVGFNEESRGTWSEHDRDVLNAHNAVEGASAQNVQNAMLSEAIQRIQSGSIDYMNLFHQKLLVLWERDNGAVIYGSSVITHRNAFAALSNGYYYLTWVLSIIGCIFLLREKKKVFLYLFPLYLIGLTMAHMFAEVATRYHYSGILSLTILSAYGIFSLARFSLNRVKKERAHITA